MGAYLFREQTSRGLACLPQLVLLGRAVRACSPHPILVAHMVPAIESTLLSPLGRTDSHRLIRSRRPKLVVYRLCMPVKQTVAPGAPEDLLCASIKALVFGAGQNKLRASKSSRRLDDVFRSIHSPHNDHPLHSCCGRRTGLARPRRAQVRLC